MHTREMEHIEDCCSLEEHRKCWANYDHRIDTITAVDLKYIGVEKQGTAAHSTLTECDFR